MKRTATESDREFVQVNLFRTVLSNTPGQYFSKSKRGQKIKPEKTETFRHTFIHILFTYQGANKLRRSIQTTTTWGFSSSWGIPRFSQNQAWDIISPTGPETCLGSPHPMGHAWFRSLEASDQGPVNGNSLLSMWSFCFSVDKGLLEFQNVLLVELTASKSISSNGVYWL